MNPTVWAAIFAMGLIACIALMLNVEPNHVFTPFFEGLAQ
jgi:hypothetical protein